MSKRMRVASVVRLFCGLALIIGALVVPAYADSISGRYTLPLSTVNGTFVFDTATDVFTGTLSFGSIFSGVNENFSQAGTCSSGTCAETLNTIASGDNLSYKINLNLSTDQYSASGKISNPSSQMSWAYSGKATDTVVITENWGLFHSLVLFALALFAFEGLTRLGVLRKN